LKQLLSSSPAGRLCRAVATLTALCAAAPVAAHAQGAGTSTGTIKGTVVEATTSRPITDVQVSIEGTGHGAVTSQDGQFTITGITPGAVTVRARRIGFTSTTVPATVTAGSTTPVTIQLREAAISLDQVVVTGTAGATEKRKVGNAITTVDVGQLTTESSLNNVTDVLQGKTPGVMIVPGSGTPGTAADIRIRGTSSISASNRPIFYIDGVRYNDGQLGSYQPAGNGYSGGTFGQGTSALDAINPEDIEKIEVIKGPAAATLYGADAAGGVIQIITKKGARGQKASWLLKGEYGKNDWALPTPTNYATCTAARVADTVNWPGCTGQTVGTVLTDNPLQRDPNALRSGTYQNEVVSVRGGADKYTYYVSGDRTLDQGVFFNSYDNKKSGRGNFGYTLSDKLNLALNATYIQDNLRLPLNDDAAAGIVISAVRGQPGSKANDAYGFRILGPATSNGYDNETTTDRTILGSTVNWTPFAWMRNRLTVGMDYTSPLATVYYAPGSAFAIGEGDYPNGFIAQRTPQTHLYTFDYAGTISNHLSDNVTSDFSVGVQGNRTDYRRIEASGSGLPSPEFQTVGAATTVSGSTGYSAQASLGYYLQEQLGWANRLFVTGAVRADDNSAFGVKFDKVYYPKFAVSYVASEEPALRSVFSAIHANSFKFRAAYGQAGHAPGPYDALRTYTASKVITGGNTAVGGLIPSATGNEDLHAEKGIETEVGFDASFFSDRVGIEYTHYDKKTVDALLQIPNAPSLGFTSSRYVNFGRLSNSGNEIGVTLHPIQRGNFAWDATVNYSTNHNNLDRLDYQGLTSISVYDPYLAVTSQRLVEGYPVAGWWATDAKRNADGSYVTDAKGNLVVDTLRYVGSSTPTYEGSVSNTFTFFKNFRLYGLIDFKGGYYLLNQKDRNRDQTSNRNSLHFNNGSLSTLDSAYYSSSAITAPWIQPGDFAKLRDVSLTYTLPESFAHAFHVGGASLTVAGHNLGFISKRYPGVDPEVNFIGQSSFLAGSSNFLQFLRVDSYTPPMTRRWTTALTLNF